MVKGLYFVDWSNNETKQTGLNDVQYDIPASTMVEVIAKTAGKYTFSIPTLPSVSTGFTSVPIAVSISNAPHQDVTVNIAVSGTPANVSINPSALTFGPDINVLYFQIQVASNYDLTLGTVQTLLFTLTGTSAYSYAVVTSLKFTITQASTTLTPGNIVSWGLGQATRTSQTAAPSSDQIGVIYFQLAPSGTAVPSFSSLKSSVTALISQNGTNANDGKDEGANGQSDPKTGETWIQFQRRLYSQHLETAWLGSVAMPTTTGATTAALKFTWLWASTTYQLSGYLDNLSSSSTSPTVRTETFTTLATADVQPFDVKFAGLVAQSFSNNIATAAATVQGVNPLRLFNPLYATSTSRVLQTGTTTVAYTTFTYTLLVNRFSESPSPSDQAKITTSAQTAQFNTLLAAGGVSNTLTSVTNGAVPTKTTPAWTTQPTSGGSTVNSVTVSLRANTAGQTCCVALSSSSTAPTAEQVMLGLDNTNTPSSGVCITTDLTSSSNSVQISNLQSSTSYYVYCSATDNYPQWPTYMSYSTTNPMTPVAITTLSSGTTVVTGASYLGGLLAVLALLFH